MIIGFTELALVMLFAAILGSIARFLKQPLIIAYLATGLLMGYMGFVELLGESTFQLFSDLGITFLLFLIGLEINYESIRLVGRQSLIIGVLQVVVTAVVGFLIAVVFNFSALHSFYIAIALTFSSTIVVVKLLLEKKDQNSLYGRMSIGALLVQDFIAIFILIFLGGIEAKESMTAWNILFALIKGVALFVGMLYLGRKILPRLFDRIASSQELLFVVSLAWVFLVGVLVQWLGFPLEIGGFLAGIALANSLENFQIAGRIRPLRDFFILIFFVILGSSLVGSSIQGVILPIIGFSLFVLIGNPLIVLVIMGMMGYRKRTAFFAGITLAQISEFSLVLVALGFQLGHLSSEIVGLVTGVGVLTITVSTYLIMHADRIFRWISPYLSVFERQEKRGIGFALKEFKKPIILIGAHRTGEMIASGLRKKDLLVIDFDPEVINRLRKHGFDFIFGDVSDPDIFEKANFKHARLVISTMPDFEDNIILLRLVRALKAVSLGKQHALPKIVIRADEEREARIYYDEGADYVLLPHFSAGHHLANIIATHPDFINFEQLKKQDQMFLNADVFSRAKESAHVTPLKTNTQGHGRKN